MNISTLRKIMKVRGFTQDDLAVKLEISPTALSQALIRGDFKVSWLEKISKILNVPITVLLEEDSDTIGTDIIKIIGNNNNVSIGHGNHNNNNTVSEIDLLSCKKEV